MEYLTSGNSTVDAMGHINISGNVIPQIWYSTITREANGKPYLLAITLLADIVYWHRPSEIRDEQNGRVIGWKKKFKSDLLQKTYKQYAELYGESKRSIKAALDRLETLGVIHKVFREVVCDNGMILSNVMYIELNVDTLNRLTFPNRYVIESDTNDNTDYVDSCEGNKDKSHGVTSIPNPNKSEVLQNIDDTLSYETTEVLQNIDGGCEKKEKSLMQKKEIQGTKGGTTNTINTTSNTYGDYNNLINPIATKNIGGEDKIDEIEEYTKIIKNNIHYDSLKVDLEDKIDCLDEIINLIVETIVVNAKTVRINKQNYPHKLVKSCFLKLNSEHIRYVFMCLENQYKKVENMRNYLVTALYNAPFEMHNHYNNMSKQGL